MQEGPVVSVDIPCYNHEKYIGEAIESVLDQTYKNIELIVYDNGSQDNSYEVIKKYQKYNSKGRTIHCFRLEENNSWEASYRENCIATGKYRAILCSDDVWKPEKLEHQIEIMENHQEVSACAAWFVRGNENLSEIYEQSIFLEENHSRAGWMSRLLLQGNCLAWSSAVFREDVYRKLLHRGHTSLPDYWAWLQCVFYGNIYVVPKILGIMRWHPTGENRNESSPSVQSLIRGENEYADIVGWVLENMPDELFLEAFKDWLIDPAVSETGEIECEKFFVLKKMAENLKELYYEVLKFFYQHFQMTFGDGDGRELRNFAYFMITKYHYTHRDFMEWSSRMSYSSWIRNQKEMKQETDKAEKKCRILEHYTDQKCTEGEKRYIKRQLYRSFTEEEQSIVTMVYHNLMKIYDYVTDMTVEELVGDDNYKLIVESLQDIADVIDEYYNYFEFIGISEICCETWDIYKELLTLAATEKVDLKEAVIPYIQEIIHGLSVLGI